MGIPRTLEGLLDHREICDLLYRYAHALDEKDWARLKTCFLPDAVAIYGEVLGRRDGYEAIEKTCQAALNPLDSSQHIISNPEIDIDGDRATARCYVHAQHTKAGTPGGDNRVLAGIYLDEIVRTPDGWRISQRELKVLWLDGNPAVLGG